MSRLRCLFVAGFIGAMLWPAISLAQFPYEGVTTTKVKVRSGPSENHYATAMPDRDTHVTVVREEPNGWLAIEPPDGSFSWISGQFVREISPTEGEVTGDNVQVHIGTPFDERQKDSVRKTLNRGDRVRILDKKISGQGQLMKIWYKIAPPPGEMRYVSAQYIQPVSGPRTNPRNSNASSSPKPADLVDENRAILPSKIRAKAGTEDESEEVPIEHRPARAAKDSSPRDILERANAAYKDMMKKSLPDRDVDQVLALYEQATEWAKNDADRALVAQRLDELESQRARQAKFAEFDRLVRESKKRDEALLSMPRGKKAESAENRSASDDDAQRAATPRYDASGVLRRCTAIIDGKPTYVLVSPQGGIRYYVTPSPGIDLKKYLDQVVAVRGPIAYKMEVRAQHITVRDITTIDVKR